MFGEYELLAEIAQGGMGVVYRARQRRLNRVVALKMIRAGQLASPLDVQRLHAEAEAAARLDHPAIVPIYEVGHSQGHHFFTMKLIEGTNLAQHVSDEHWQVDTRNTQHRAAVLVATVAQAVHYAHQHGILHRDLKPANILLDAQGEPHVGDFGLAKQVGASKDADATHAAALTQSGMIVGTPGYMAPEQASGHRALTTAVDVYSLGAILFHLLTRRPPFVGATPIDTVLQVLESDPPRPTSLNPQLDRDLETICLKCLEKAPEKRYASAQNLADDLKRWQAGEPIKGRRTSRRERAVKWMRRHPGRAALLGVTALSLLFLVLLAGFLWHNAEMRAEAVQSLDKARHDLQAAHQEKQAAEYAAARSNEAAEKKRTEVTHLEGLAKLAQDKARQILFAADMQSAKAAWENEDIARLTHLLEIHVPAADQVDCRDFEWHYLTRLTNRARWTFPGQGPNDFALLLALAPDGKTLASLGAGQKNLKLWNLDTGKFVRDLPVPDVPIALAFAADGRSLQLTAVRPGDPKKLPSNFPDILGGKAKPSLQPLLTQLVMHTVDLAQQQPLTTAKFDRSRLTVPLALTAAGNKTLSVSMSGTVALGKTGLLMPTGLAACPDGKTLAVSGILTRLNPGKPRLAASGSPVIHQEGVVLLWDTATNKELALLTGHTSLVMALAYAPDGMLASASLDKTVKLWSREGQELATLGGGGPVMAACFTGDGQRLMAAGMNGTLKIWDVPTRQLLQIIPGHHDGISGLSMTSDGQHLATAGADGTVKVWSIPKLAPPAPVVFANTVRALMFAPDGQNVLALDADGAFIRADAVTGKVLDKRQLLDKHSFLKVALAPTGDAVAIFEQFKSSVRVFDLATGKVRHTFHTPFVLAVAFAADGKALGVAGGDGAKSGMVKLWNLDSGKELPSPPEFTRAVSQLTFCPQGKHVAYAIQGKVMLWDREARKVLWEKQRSNPTALAFSHDGTLLAVADGATISVMHTSAGNEILAFPTYIQRIASLAFSPTGKRLASLGAADLTGHRGRGLKLWDVATGRETITLGDASGSCLAFSPDGRRLAAGFTEEALLNRFGRGQRSEVRIWDSSSD